MNKEEFLKELQARICILAEPEQQDILAEYAQHIDLRTAAGLTEEEAIRDFGDPGQLAAEILEAYHVDPSRLGMPGPLRTPLLPRLSAGLKGALSKLGGLFHKLGTSARDLARRWGQGIATGFCRCRLALSKCFHQIPRPRISPVKPAVKEVSPMETKTNPHPVLTGAGRTLRRAGRGLGRLFLALLHVAWNLLLILCALPFAAASMLALVCIGLLIALLVQGYPLTGLLLCCLGASLCCAAVLGLGVTLIWRRPQKTILEAAPAPQAAVTANILPPLSPAAELIPEPAEGPAESEVSDHA